MAKLKIRIWKTIPGYSTYQASKSGHIRNSKGHVMTPQENDLGYLRVRIKADDGKYYSRRVHRLVAITWLTDGYQPGYDVDHINYDRSDNRVENLRWISHRENIMHSVAAGHFDGIHSGAPIGKSGERYIFVQPSGRYRVRVMRLGIDKYFQTLEEAVKYRDIATANDRRAA